MFGIVSSVGGERGPPILSVKKILAGLLALLVFVQDSLLAASWEANVWKERQSSLSRIANSRFSPFVSFPQILSAPPTKSFDLLASLSAAKCTLRSVTGPANGPVVVHIQDVHANEEAQRNIAEAVTRLMNSGGVGQVGLEGAFGPIPLENFYGDPDGTAVKTTADYFLRKNKISGPVYAAVVRNKAGVSFIGIDSEADYNANVEAYRRSIRRVQAVKGVLDAERLRVEREKSIYFSPALAAFDAAVQKFSDEKVGFGDYVLELVRHESQRGASVEKFLEALKIERSIDFKTVERERDRVVQAVVARLDGEALDDFMRKAVVSRTQPAAAGDFYEHLAHLCRRRNISLDQAGSFKAYLRYNALSKEIKSEDLFSETRTLERRVYARLAATEKEKTLIDESRRLRLASKLLGFALTNSEWDDYKALKDRDASFDAGSFEAFYKQAEIRDEKMASHFLSAIRGRNDISVLVTGGFHSSGITRRLSSAGYQVMTFSPNLTKIESAKGSGYLTAFAREKTPLEKLFQGEKLFLAFKPAEKLFTEYPVVRAVLDPSRAGVHLQRSPLTRRYDYILGTKSVFLNRGNGRAAIVNVKKSGSVIEDVSSESISPSSAGRLVLPFWNWVFSHRWAARQALKINPALETMFGVTPDKDIKAWAEKFTASDLFALKWAPWLELAALPGFVLGLWTLMGIGWAILTAAAIFAVMHGVKNVSVLLARFAGTAFINGLSFLPLIVTIYFKASLPVSLFWMLVVVSSFALPLIAYGMHRGWNWLFPNLRLTLLRTVVQKTHLINGDALKRPSGDERSELQAELRGIGKGQLGAYLRKILQQTSTWATNVQQLQFVTHPQKKQPFRIRVVTLSDEELEVSTHVDRYARTKYTSSLTERRRGRHHGPTVNGQRVKEIVYGYEFQDEFRSVGPIQSLLIDGEGRVTDMSFASERIMFNFMDNHDGKGMSQETLRRIAGLNAKLFSYLNENYPAYRKRVEEFVASRDWPAKLARKANLAYCNLTREELIEWAKANDYELTDMALAGWLRVNFSDNGDFYYAALNKDVILIPNFNSEGGIVSYKKRHFGEAAKLHKYTSFPTNRAIIDDFRVQQSLFTGARLERIQNKEIIITEGEIKALAAEHFTGIPTLGIPGITQMDATMLEAIINARPKKITIILDRDPIGKGLMRTDGISDSERAMAMIALSFVKAGYPENQIRIATLPDVFEGRKNGLDDYLLHDRRTLDPSTKMARLLKERSRSLKEYLSDIRLDRGFLEIHYRMKTLRTALRFYFNSAARGGHVLPENRVNAYVRQYHMLHRAFRVYLSKQFGGATTLNRPYHRFRATIFPGEVRSSEYKVVRDGDGAYIPLPRFANDIILLDYPDNLSNLNLPFSTKGLTPRQILERIFPTDEYEYRENVSFSILKKGRQDRIVTSPLVIFKNSDPENSPAVLIINSTKVRFNGAGKDSSDAPGNREKFQRFLRLPIDFRLSLPLWEAIFPEWSKQADFHTKWVPLLELPGLPGFALVLWPFMGIWWAILTASIVFALIHGVPFFLRGPPKYFQTIPVFFARWAGAGLINTLSFLPLILTIYFRTSLPAPLFWLLVVLSSIALPFIAYYAHRLWNWLFPAVRLSLSENSVEELVNDYAELVKRKNKSDRRTYGLFQTLLYQRVAGKLTSNGVREILSTHQDAFADDSFGHLTLLLALSLLLLDFAASETKETHLIALQNSLGILKNNRIVFYNDALSSYFSIPFVLNLALSPLFSSDEAISDYIRLSDNFRLLPGDIGERAFLLGVFISAIHLLSAFSELDSSDLISGIPNLSFMAQKLREKNGSPARLEQFSLGLLMSLLPLYPGDNRLGRFLWRFERKRNPRGGIQEGDEAVWEMLARQFQKFLRENEDVVAGLLSKGAWRRFIRPNLDMLTGIRWSYVYEVVHFLPVWRKRFGTLEDFFIATPQQARKKGLDRKKLISQILHQRNLGSVSSGSFDEIRNSYSVLRSEWEDFKRFPLGLMPFLRSWYARSLQGKSRWTPNQVLFIGGFLEEGIRFVFVEGLLALSGLGLWTLFPIQGTQSWLMLLSFLFVLRIFAVEAYAYFFATYLHPTILVGDSLIPHHEKYDSGGPLRRQLSGHARVLGYFTFIAPLLLIAAVAAGYNPIYGMALAGAVLALSYVFIGVLHGDRNMWARANGKAIGMAGDDPEQFRALLANEISTLGWDGVEVTRDLSAAVLEEMEKKDDLNGFVDLLRIHIGSALEDFSDEDLARLAINVASAFNRRENGAIDSSVAVEVRSGRFVVDDRIIAAANLVINQISNFNKIFRSVRSKDPKRYAASVAEKLKVLAGRNLAAANLLSLVTVRNFTEKGLIAVWFVANSLPGVAIDLKTIRYVLQSGNIVFPQSHAPPSLIYRKDWTHEEQHRLYMMLAQMRHSSLTVLKRVYGRMLQYGRTIATRSAGNLTESFLSRVKDSYDPLLWEEFWVQMLNEGKLVLTDDRGEDVFLIGHRAHSFWKTLLLLANNQNKALASDMETALRLATRHNTHAQDEAEATLRAIHQLRGKGVLKDPVPYTYPSVLNEKMLIDMTEFSGVLNKARGPKKGTGDVVARSLVKSAREAVERRVVKSAGAVAAAPINKRMGDIFATEASQEEVELDRVLEQVRADLKTDMVEGRISFDTAQRMAQRLTVWLGQPVDVSNKELKLFVHPKDVPALRRLLIRYPGVSVAIVADAAQKKAFKRLMAEFKGRLNEKNVRFEKSLFTGENLINRESFLRSLSKFGPENLANSIVVYSSRMAFDSPAEETDEALLDGIRYASLEELSDLIKEARTLPLRFIIRMARALAENA